MQLNSLTDVEKVANRVNFSIFELPKTCGFSKIFEKSYHVALEINPNTNKLRNEITKPQIDQLSEISHNKQSGNIFFVVEHADLLNKSAANTFLKNLEEPGEHIHYVFLTHNATNILPTIKSRASNYYIADSTKISDAPSADIDIFKVAKEYVGANTSSLPTVVDNILKLNKTDNRKAAIDVVDCGIELMYKSYLLRGNPAFLQKLEKLLQTQAALAQNGNVKLQLIANML